MLKNTHLYAYVLKISNAPVKPVTLILSVIYQTSTQMHKRLAVTSGLLQIQRDLFNGEVGVERGDLLAHDEEMFDEEELAIYLSLWRKCSSLMRSHTHTHTHTHTLLSGIKPALNPDGPILTQTTLHEQVLPNIYIYQQISFKNRLCLNVYVVTIYIIPLQYI